MLVKKSPLLYRYSRDVFVPPRAPQPVVLACVPPSDFGRVRSH